MLPAVVTGTVTTLIDLIFTPIGFMLIAGSDLLAPSGGGARTIAPVAFTISLMMLIMMPAVGVGLVPARAPDFYEQFPASAHVFLKSRVATGTTIAVARNLLFHALARKPPRGESGTARRYPGPPGVAAIGAHALVSTSRV